MAKRWAAVFAMRVDPEVLGKYTAPNVGEDEDGYFLIGALVQEIDAVIAGQVPISRLVSYGKFLVFEFPFRAQRRRSSAEEILNLRVVHGPCDSNHPVVCVLKLDPPF